MKIKDLKKFTISALVLVMNNPSLDDETRRNAEIEFRSRLRNLGYDINDFAQEELAVITGRGYNINDYLIGPNPSMQLLMQMYFAYHNANLGERTLLFSETHLCNDLYERNSFFTTICEIEVANLEKRMMFNQCTDSLVAAYNTLLERVLDARLKKSPAGNYSRGSVPTQIYSYGNNVSDEERSRIESSPILRVREALMERLNDTVMQTNFAQYKYEEHFIKRDASLLSRQRNHLYAQAKSGYDVDYNTDDMARALRISK